MNNLSADRPALSEADLERFMAVALEESRHALPACLPNPPVGCVIVRDGVIVSRGFTGAPGMPHAEAAALRTLDAGPPDTLTLFVTLEPCAFVGERRLARRPLLPRASARCLSAHSILMCATTAPASRSCAAPASTCGWACSKVR